MIATLIAAIALEHRATIFTLDKDFMRILHMTRLPFYRLRSQRSPFRRELSLRNEDPDIFWHTGWGICYRGHKNGDFSSAGIQIRTPNVF